MKRVFSVWLIWVSLCGLGQAAEISGIVKTSAGTPLAGVNVLCGHSLKDGFAVTELDGAFSFAVRCRVLYFQHKGYQPLAKIVTTAEHRFEIELEESTGKIWVAPRCQPAVTDKHPGFSLRLSPPVKAIVSQGHDVDYGYFSIGYGPKRERVWLKGSGNGPYASLGVPPEGWLLNSREFSVRAFRSGSVEGMDIRGQANDGTYWRYAGVLLKESMSYSGVSAEAAAYFDNLIDGACAWGR